MIGPQVLARLGQVIFASAGLRVVHLRDDPGILQFLQPLRQQGRRHARHALAQVVEAVVAAEQLAQKQRCPACTDDFGCHRDRAELAVARLIHVVLRSPGGDHAHIARR